MLNYNDIGQFKISYKTLYTGAVITLLLVGIFMLIAHFSRIPYEIRDIIAMLTCGIVSTTLLYHAKNLKLNFDANRAKLEFDKQKFEEEKKLRIEEQKGKQIIYSFEVSTIWFKGEMAENVELARSFLLSNKDRLINGSIQDVIKILDDDKRTRRAVVCILNYFENLCLMIKNDIADEETLKQCFKTVIVDYHKVLRRYIDEVQKISSRYLMNYEDIAKKWEKN